MIEEHGCVGFFDRCYKMAKILSCLVYFATAVSVCASAASKFTYLSESSQEAGVRQIFVTGSVAAPAWKKLLLYPNVEKLSLSQVNQCSFFEPGAWNILFDTLGKLSIRELDFSNQPISDILLSRIPSSVVTLNLCQTSVEGWGVEEYLSGRNIEVITEP